MSEKYTRILKFCDRQLDKVMKVFKKQKHRPPIARNFPPLSGNYTIFCAVFLEL